MSSQKIYVVFIFQVSIKYRICQLVIFKIKEKKYIYRAGDKTRLWLFVCGDALLGVYFKSISRVGSGDSISVSTIGMSCVCWFCIVVSGINVRSIFDRSVS